MPEVNPNPGLSGVRGSFAFPPGCLFFSSTYLRNAYEGRRHVEVPRLASRADECMCQV